MRRLTLVAASLLSACVTTSPRFEQDLATTFAQDDMHKLVTADVELYYPKEYEAAAKVVAARATECLRALRAHDDTRRDYGRALLFLTSANYNNAYVGGLSFGEPLHSVNPLSVTSELFHWYGLGGADVGDIACHEMFHFAHYEQTHGFWDAVNTVFGPVLPPQTFLERWFTEGVAQYYEGRLQRAVGRPHSPLYRGSFDSFVALRRGAIGAGDLSIFQRELNPYSGAYLTGLHFIEWLVSKYGEDQLWSVMDLQGRSVFSPLGATLRVKSVYGLSIGALLEAWEKDLTQHLVVRTRPLTEKTVLEDVGQLARLAVHPASGAMAVISSGNEEVPMLRILERDGSVRVEKRLVNLAIGGRPWVFAGPGSMSGLSFTADGKSLWLLNDDLIARGDTRAQLWRIDASNGDVKEVIQNVSRGMGGSISADGLTFTFVDFPAGQSRIVERAVDSGLEQVIVELPPGVSASAPQWNAAHTQLVYSRFDSNGWNLVVRAADGSERPLTTDGQFNYGARWVDDSHLIFARTSGRYLQAHRFDLDTGLVEKLTDTPYGLIDPAVAGDEVFAVVRDGIHWSIDRMPAAALETVTLDLTPPPEKHEPPPLKVESDEEYSSLDHLFLPQARAPNGTITPTFDPTTGQLTVNATASLSLMGRDRLGKHTWLLSGTVGIPDFTYNDARATYRNLTLAPWGLTFTAGRNQFDRIDTFWDASVFLSRAIFTVPIAFGVQSLVWQRVGAPLEAYVGPSISLSGSAGDSTAYGGPSRLIAFTIDVSGYPVMNQTPYVVTTPSGEALSLPREPYLLDLRGTLSFAVPLPVSKRHSFTFGGVGRSLPGAPVNALRIGGVSSFNTVVASPSSTTIPAGPGVLLPGSLIEPLRGFDDFGFRAQHAVTWGGSYRYRFIVDRGTASILWILPSFFFRQIDLEGFGSGVFTSEGALAGAAGAAISFRMVFAGSLGVSLTYQFAYRFFATQLPPLHVVGFSFD